MNAEVPEAVVPETWPVLNVYERRLLGVLVEKAKTTPDVYPMSLNALVAGANQKSNRDPVLNMAEDDVEGTLRGLQKKGFVTQVQGGRVDRWRHNLYERFTDSKVGMAVITELLLRGPQTEGELRGRASRMEPIEDLESLRHVLRPLVERKLVVFLGPEGRRGTLITHGFHAAEELGGLRSRAAVDSIASTKPQTAMPDELRAEIVGLRSELQQLQDAHRTLADEFHAFRKSLEG